MASDKSPRPATDLRERRTLNLGSGEKYDPDAVNLDVTPATNPDVVHDLDTTPWPFANSSFDHVRMIDVLEHLKDPHIALQEIHRITTPGGTVEIVCPHFSSHNAFTDITHRGFFGFGSFDTFTGASPHSYYFHTRFAYRERQLHFEAGTLNRIVARWARSNPERYERRWAWIVPAWFIRWELAVVKSPA